MVKCRVYSCLVLWDSSRYSTTMPLSFLRWDAESWSMSMLKDGNNFQFLAALSLSSRMK